MSDRDADDYGAWLCVHGYVPRYCGFCLDAQVKQMRAVLTEILTEWHSVHNCVTRGGRELARGKLAAAMSTAEYLLAGGKLADVATAKLETKP